MSRRTRIAAQRVADAYRTLRGEPPKPDYGILVVFPFLAAAGGSLFALAVEMTVDRHRMRRSPHDPIPPSAEPSGG
jgi:hypothetical protein